MFLPGLVRRLPADERDVARITQDAITVQVGFAWAVVKARLCQRIRLRKAEVAVRPDETVVN